jgi:hypothetical protein
MAKRHSGSPWLAAKTKKINVEKLTPEQCAEVQQLVQKMKTKNTSNSSNSNSETEHAAPSAKNQRQQPDPKAKSKAVSNAAAAAPKRELRNTQRAPPAQPPDVDMTDQPTPKTADTLPNPVSNRVVIFDNIINITRKELEPELYRVAPWLHPDAVDVMHSGGLRVKCKTPADADRLLKRDGFPDNAFRGPFTVHRPGKIDQSRPVSTKLNKDLRTVITARLPMHYDADDLRTFFDPQYVEEIKTIPPKDLNRPPLRLTVMKSLQLRDEVIKDGLKFLNRVVPVRPLRAPVLPLFCRKCSGLDHTAVDCKSKKLVCAKCSGNHNYNDCNIQQVDAVCPNCPDGANHHFATYRGCPAYRAATVKESQRRQARVTQKIAARENRYNGYRPAQPRSENPAPVRQGLSYASATRANQQPINNQPTATQSDGNNESILTLLRSIQNEIQTLKSQIGDQQRRFNEFEKMQQRLEEHYEGGPSQDDEEDEDDQMIYDDELSQQSPNHNMRPEPEEQYYG